MGGRLIFLLILCTLIVSYSVYDFYFLSTKLSSSADYYKTNSILKSLPLVKLKDVYSNKLLSTERLARGNQPVFVHFWATWCGPCETEIPELKKLIQSLDGTDFIFLFVAVNDNSLKVKKFISEHSLDKLKQVIFSIDNNDVYKKHFGSYKLPESFVFSRNKLMLKKYEGAQKWDNSHFKNFFSEL